MILSHSPFTWFGQRKSVLGQKYTLAWAEWKVTPSPLYRTLGPGWPPESVPARGSGALLRRGGGIGLSSSQQARSAPLNGEGFGERRTDCFSAQIDDPGIAIKLAAARAGKGGGDGQDRLRDARAFVVTAWRNRS